MLETGHLFPPPPVPTRMAPSIPIPAQGIAGPSNWFHQRALDWYDAEEQVGRGRGYAKRSLQLRKRGKLTPVYATESVINDHGLFNGSCANTQLQSSPLHTMEGTCASYYPDVTVYCCSGVRGTLRTIPWGIQGEQSVLSSIAAGGSATSSSSTSTSTATATDTDETTSDDDDTTEEPLCETTNYADALACFKLTAETNCKTGQSGLFGLCNSIGEDTSTVTTSLSSTSIMSSGAVGVQHGWKSRLGAAVLVTTLLLATHGF